MARFVESTEGADKVRYVKWMCPGCGWPHIIPVSGPKAWGFNGNLDAPTLTPSLKTTHTYPKKEWVCHSFVTDGRQKFENDSTHSLAGQTVDLPEYDGSDGFNMDLFGGQDMT